MFPPGGPYDSAVTADDEQSENDAETAETPDGDTAPAASPESSPRQLSRLAAVLGVAVVVLAVLFVLTFVDRSRLEDEVDRTDDIAAVAGQFGVTLYTYDHRDIDGQLERLEALSTPSFAADYRQDFEANLRAQIVERQVVSTSEVTDVLVSQSDGDQARAIVIASTTVERPSGQSATISGLVDLSMLRVDGKWLVDKVLTIANDGNITDSEGNPVTPTTAPDGSTGSVSSVPDETEQEPGENGE